MTVVLEPTTQAALPAAVTMPDRYRFTAAQYQRLGAAGILGAEDRVELMDGEILAMGDIGHSHAAHVAWLTTLLARKSEATMVVSTQNPLDLGQRYQPQPDLMLLREHADRYNSALPTAEDVLLLVEVADSSLGYDQRIKLAVYAQAGIAEVWIVNLDAGQVELYTQPQGAAYSTQRIVRRGETVAIGALPAVTLPADDILL
ncbi:MAG: Uma2 family endonuclease [Chloroflexota bacterium]|nr:Uma2 family endonuclease [Chloroflexota bacterium]